jgi:cytoskeleton protein RodZ
MPTGFVLLVAAVLAAAAYGSWYYLTLHDRDAGEIVASLPQRIADMVGLNLSSDKTAAPPPTAEPPPVAAPVPKMDAPVSPGPVVRKSAAPAESRAVTKPAPPVPAETAPPARIEPSPPSAQPTARESVAVAPPPAAVEPPPAQREAPAETGTASEAVAPAGEAAPPPSSANEPATAGRELAVPQPAVPTETPSPTPAPESAPEIATAPPAPAPAPAPESLASAPAGSSRVVLRATAISWVELRDADGRRVFSRLLKKGESFNVPPQPGITLATGNAGAIDILVDGQAVAPIGPVGAVRRDVLLEPDALLRAGAPVQ